MQPEPLDSNSFVVDPQGIRARALGVLREFWPQLRPLVTRMVPMARAAGALALNLDKVPAFLLPAALRDNLPGPSEREALRQLLQSLQTFEDSSSRSDGFTPTQDPYQVAAEQLLLMVPEAWIAKWGPLAKWILTG